MKKLILIIAAIILIAFAIGVWQKMHEEPWVPYPSNIIVDTPEEFQRKNTP